MGEISDRVREVIDRKIAETDALCRDWAGTLEGEAKQRAPWRDRTSHARQGLHGGVERESNTFTIYLAHSMVYGRYLEEGTPPHVIKPKNKKALYWWGANHPVMIVHHPGTKAMPAIRPTFDANITRVRKTLHELWSDDQ